MSDDIIALLLVFGTFGWIAWVLVSSFRRYKIAKLRTGVQTRLLDKFGTGQEFAAYMQTGSGKELLGRLAEDPGMVTGRILDAVQAGYVLAVAGAALLLLRHWLADSSKAVLVFGVLSLGLGLAFWASAWHTRTLAKRFGLMPGNHRKAD